jgi:UDP-N-acetylmuramyl tripeptide synthase
MLLKNLISNLKPNFASLKIRGISSDSRNLKKGHIFISVKGNKFDGNKYINQAISKGANVIVHSRSIKKNKKTIFIKVKDPRETLARMSTKYYKKKPKNIIAVTGTNGKTSISHFFHQIFTNQKKRVGFIGTLGFKKNNYLKRRSLTTSDPLSLNKDLEEMKKAEINNVIIEASSHGLKQKRLDFLKIKAGIFTNLSRDHLDYHQNMNNYLNSKLILFHKTLKKRLIYNYRHRYQRV